MEKSIILFALIGGVFGQLDPLFDDGHYGIVHLFEWHYDDIANECEQFLGPHKFGGVQISPPTENRIIQDITVDRPWWERYQPIGYGFTTRSGDEDSLRSMVARCNAVGVRIYADAILNHMCAANEKGYGTGGTYYDSTVGHENFTGVPYGPEDFNSCIVVEDQNDPAQIRNCDLYNLADLNQTFPDVQGKLVTMMNHLIDMGVAGFRIDAAKHMWPSELGAMFDATNSVTVPGKEGSRPFIYQEVSENFDDVIVAQEYVGNGAVTEFQYCQDVAENNATIANLAQLQNVDDDLLDSDHALIFINNHDNQRGHGAQDGEVITFNDPDDLKALTAYMMTYNYGIPRIMSSYYFTNSDEGPPSEMPPPYAEGSHVYDCGGPEKFQWVCEHRWLPIRNLPELGYVSQGVKQLTYSDDPTQLTVVHLGKSVLSLNNGDEKVMSVTLSTGLPGDCYCNVYTSDKDVCTDKIRLNGGALSEVVGPRSGLAIHINAICPQQ